MYNLLKQKYNLTKSKKLILKKHVYIKKEYIIKLLKKENIILEKHETYNKIANEILKKENIICYVSYINNYCHDRIYNINNYCHDRILNKKDIKICFHPPCLKKVENDNYCDIHQDEKICNF